jgi:PHD/YefM family antitoxin component YafN of YafNO toxin-antitoxin module
MEMVTIPKKEYERLKSLDTDEEIAVSVKRSFQDLREGNYREV